jgi:glycosyltransferase involved in cell wall biosynthesis
METAKSMKVLHIESGKNFYGGALQVVLLMRGLKAMGVDNILACPTGSAIATEATDCAQVLTMPMGGDLDFGLTQRLRTLIRQVRPDVIQLHSRRGSDVWGGLAARLEGVPTVLCRRVDNPESRWVVNLKYRLYDKVIAISEGIRQVLLAQGLAHDKVHCVLDAVDTEQYRPDTTHMAWFRQAFAIADDECTIGMVAQFIPRKGHATLLEALPAVISANPKVKILLFGQGPQRDHIQHLVVSDPLLSKHVRLPGFSKDLARALPCMDMLAHPAFMEGLGVSLLQAAACGVPIVAARAGGIPEVVKDQETGFLFTPGDSLALARHLNQLLASEKLRRAMGQAGRQRVEALFSIATMVQGTLAVYRKLVR